MICWQEARLITAMPFADQLGRIALILQHAGNGPLLRIKSDRHTWEEHPLAFKHVKTNTVGITTCQHAPRLGEQTGLAIRNR